MMRPQSLRLVNPLMQSRIRLPSFRHFSSGSIRLGKNRNSKTIKQETYDPSAPPPVAQQNVAPPQHYQEQQPYNQPPPTFGQSLVLYLILGFGITFGITLVRMVFAEGKYDEAELDINTSRPMNMLNDNKIEEEEHVTE